MNARQWTTGALSAIALTAYANDAAARCQAEITNVTTGGYTVQYDFTISGEPRISGEIEARLNADTAFRTVTHPQGQVTATNANGAVSLSYNDRHGSGSTQVSSGELRRLISDYRSGGSDLYNLARQLCQRAKDGTNVPTVTRTVEPPRVETPRVQPPRVQPPRIQTPPPVRESFAPTGPVPIPQARPSCGVQPVVVLEIPCDCEILTTQAAVLERIIEESLGIEVSIYQDWTENSPNDGYIRVGVQDLSAQGGTIHNNLTDENSDRFRSTEDGNLVNIEPGADFQQVYTYLMEELAAIGYEVNAPAAETAAPAAAPTLSGQVCTPAAPRG